MHHNVYMKGSTVNKNDVLIKTWWSDLKPCDDDCHKGWNSRMIRYHLCTKPVQSLISEPKKSANLEQKLHCLIHPLSTLTCPFFQTLMVNPYSRHLSCLCHCLTDWGRRPLSTSHTSLSSQRVKCSDGRLFSTKSTITSMMRFFTTQNKWGMSSNMLCQEASIQQWATKIGSLKWHVTFSTRNLDRSRGSNVGWGNT